MVRLRSNRLINTILFSLVAISAAGQVSTSRPKIVVGIVVDQLRTDYLDYLKRLFGDDGFRRLMDSGVYFKDLDFRVPGLDMVSGATMMSTGAYPSRNGVPSGLIFDPVSFKRSPALGEGGNISPARISLSTIADEVAVDGIGLGAIYSIAADPQMAVAISGHATNSAVWIGEHDGLWSSSPYYGQLPAPAANRNRGKNALPARIDTIHWTPSRPLTDYPGIPAQKKIYDFRYSFPHSAKDSYSRLAASPMGNREVTDLAIDCLGSLNLGKRGEAIDMLNIGYRLSPCDYVKDGDPRLELEDAYLRLDSDLSRLFNAIENKIGLQNALIYLLPTGYYDEASIPDAKYRIPTGEFSSRRAESLLNSYLSAKYGSGDYVASFDGRQLYLDKETLRRASSPQDMITADAADFLSRMSGVESARTLRDIISSDDPALRNLSLALDPRSSGDIIINVLPGWVLCRDSSYPEVKKPVRNNALTFPGFILSPEIKSEVVTETVEAVALPPTLTQILRIRGPNGASARPLPLL